MVKWHNDDRKEHFGIIARNLSEKKALRDKGFLALILKILKRNVDKNSDENPQISQISADLLVLTD